MNSPDPWHLQKWAFAQTVGNPVRKSVLMALAVMADSNTGRCEARQKLLAQWTEAGHATIAKHLKGLEDQGLIARRAQFRHDRGRRSDEYLLLAPGVDEWPDGQPVPGRPPVDPTGGDSTSDAGGQGALNEGGKGTTTRNDHTSGGDVSAREHERGMKYRNRDVPRAVVAAAQAALAHFGEKTGQQLAPRDGTGAPSESLKRIVGAMLKHPCVVEEWRAMIDAQLADPWWADDDPGVGVIFGPGVVESSIGKGRRGVQPGRARANGRSTPWGAQDMLQLGKELDSQ